MRVLHVEDDEDIRAVTEIALVQLIEFDDGVWEIDAYRGADKRELQVDPRTGKVLRDRDD